MLISEKLAANKDKVQSFLNNLNCDSEKWFVFNTSDGKNPTLRKFSHRMSYRIMNNNTEMFKCRFMYLKVRKDMEVSYEQYVGVPSVKVHDMDIPFDKYENREQSYLRTDIFGDLSGLFSDERIYTVHYIEALGPVDPHQDPWRYSREYRNIIFYDNIPDDVQLKIKGEEIPVRSQQLTNFGNEVHTYQFKTRPFPLKILHIDYEDDGIS